MNLTEWPLDDVVITCKKCGHTASYDRDGLMVMFGDDVGMDVIRLRLLGHCDYNKSNPGDCMAILKDALLVDAVYEADLSKVLRPDFLPEARKIREQIGLVIDEYTSTEADAA